MKGKYSFFSRAEQYFYPGKNKEDGFTFPPRKKADNN